MTIQNGQDDIDSALWWAAQQSAQRSLILFHEALGSLANTALMESKPVRDLAGLTIQLLHHGYIFAGCRGHSTIQFVFFDEEETGAETVSFISLPYRWAELFSNNEFGHLTSLVFIGSLARDFHHRRMGVGSAAQSACTARASAYEAEAILSLLHKKPDLMQTSYQMDLLLAYPEGLASLPSNLQYHPQPFVPESSERLQPLLLSRFERAKRLMAKAYEKRNNAVVVNPRPNTSYELPALPIPQGLLRIAGDMAA